MSGLPPAGGLIGQLAVARGLVTPEQLRACLEVHGRDGNRDRLGDLLVSQGLLSQQQLLALLAEQTAMQAKARETGPVASAVPQARPTQKKKSGRAVDGRAIDLSLDLSEDEDPFEIETGGETREIGTVAPVELQTVPGVIVPPQGASAIAPIARPAAAAPVSVAPAAPPPMVRGEVAAGVRMLSELVAASARAVASDLHLHPGHPLMIRQQGKLISGKSAPLVAEQLEPALMDLLTPAQREVYRTEGAIETSFAVPNVARCRLVITRGVSGPAASLRIIPPIIPTLSALGLPSTLARMVTASQGLVLLAGPSGCGKSWTLAALVDIVNTERREHIVCVERPIEFAHVSKRCVVSQREVPTHAESVPRAVRAALKEDPDVLVIGEIEDAETVRLAVTAAESGVLVLATVAAGSPVRAIARVLGMFPADAQAVAASMLADALRGVVYQRLVPMAGGARRMAICGVLDNVPAAAEKIHAGALADLTPTVPFDKSLADAVRIGAITAEEARRQADYPDAFPAAGS